MPHIKKLLNFKSGKQNIVILILAIIIIGLLAVKLFPTKSTQAPEPIPSPTQTKTLNGFYKGDLPCADCPGITETLILATDNSYIVEDLYREKSEAPFKTQGKWEIINSNILKLNPEDNTEPGFYQILENGDLQTLDSNMQKIDSPTTQILTKQY